MNFNFDRAKTKEHIYAIKQYIAKCEQNAYRHEANVLVRHNKKDYNPQKLIVRVTEDGNIGEIIIEDLHTICSCCSNTFTTLNSSFSFIAGTLCIKTKDKLFGEIHINIS